MRRLCMLALGSWFIFVSVASAQNDSQKLKAYFTQAFQQRRVVIEKVHGVKFDACWQPKVTIGFPKDVPEEDIRGVEALYDPPTQSFFIYERIESVAGKEALLFSDFGRERRVDNQSPESNVIMTLIDHELGHALADQISRRGCLGQYPPKNYAVLPYEKWFGIQLVSEGIGRWFELTSLKDRSSLTGAAYLPMSPDDRRWSKLRDRFYFYESALWMVRPVLDRDVQKGVEYLIRHPLVYEYDDVWAAAHLYRKESLKAVPAKVILPPPPSWSH